MSKSLLRAGAYSDEGGLFGRGDLIDHLQYSHVQKSSIQYSINMLAYVRSPAAACFEVRDFAKYKCPTILFITSLLYFTSCYFCPQCAPIFNPISPFHSAQLILLLP